MEREGAGELHGWATETATLGEFPHEKRNTDPEEAEITKDRFIT